MSVRLSTPCPTLTPLILLAFIFTSLSTVKTQPQTLTGRVLDAETREPIAGAVVTLLEADSRRQTGENGDFSFPRLNGGRYTISVRHPAYKPSERRIQHNPDASDPVVVELQPELHPTGEMIVRSTRISSPSGEDPLPSYVKTDAALLRQPLVTIPDAVKDVPGVALARDGTWETDLSIRGMSGSNIVTMIDNTRIETATNIAGALSLLDVHDIERAELVRSPGSVLYGTGAFGGVLHLMTKRPAFSENTTINAEASSEYASVNGMTGQHGALSCSSDAFALRLSGGYRNALNTTTPIGEMPHSEFRDFHLSATMAVRTTGSQSLLFSYQRAQADDAGIPGGASFSSSAAVRYTLARRELFGIEYAVPNLFPAMPLLTLRVSHQEIDRNVEVLQTQTLTLTPHARHTTTNGQIESRILLPSRQILTVGAEVWQRDLDSRREKVNTATRQVTGELPVPRSQFFSSGVFGQDEWLLAPGLLTIVAGARYDRIHVKNDEALTPAYVISHGVLQTSPAGQHVLWDAAFSRDESWSASGGATFTPATTVTLTAVAATAFRAPSLEERFDYLNLGSIIRAGNPSLRSERSASINIGVRWHTGDSFLQADLFYNDLTDLVAYVPGTFEGADAFIEQNIGSARLYGYEVSGEARLSGWQAVAMSLAYVRGEDRLGHANLPRIAPFNGKLTSKTSIPSAGTVELSLTGFSEQGNLGPGEVLTAGYALVDMAFGSSPVAIGGTALTLRTGLENVFDKLYQNHLSTLRGFVTYEPGRNFFLSATVAL